MSDRRFGHWEGPHGEGAWMEGDGVFRPHRRFEKCRVCGGEFWLGAEQPVYYQRTKCSTPPDPYPRSYEERMKTADADHKTLLMWMAGYIGEAVDDLKAGRRKS